MKRKKLQLIIIMPKTFSPCKNEKFQLLILPNLMKLVYEIFSSASLLNDH